MAVLRRTLLMLLLLVPGTLQGQAAATPEYQVKAAFLYNFTKFVEWPDVPPGDTSPLRLCVFGDDPFGDSLDNIVWGETVAGRPLLVESIDGSEGGKPLEYLRPSCNVLFVSRSERARVRQVLDVVSGGGVLTVSDIPGFLDAGGQIEFVLADRKVRFAINQAAAERARLRISSKLLRLAVNPREVRR